MPNQLLKLTDENYYSKEADLQYMSVSQFKSFLKCEAATMARLAEKYEDPKNDALLLGSYVHAWLDGTIDKFKEDNPEIFSSKGATKGQLKSQYQNANDMIQTLESDPFCMMALDGEKEVIMTAELFGIHWKSKLDVYNPQNGRFADLKTVKSIRDKIYHEELGYCSFVEAYGYITQMAVYSEIERLNRGGERLENYIVAISKEPIPDKAVITIDNERLEDELVNVAEKLERIKAVKVGFEKPISCGSCAYCRRTKMITSVTHYSELIG